MPKYQSPRRNTRQQPYQARIEREGSNWQMYCLAYNMDAWVQQEAQLSREPCTEWGCVHRSIKLIERWVDWIKESGDDAFVVALQEVTPLALELLSRWAKQNRLCVVSPVRDGQTNVIITRNQKANIVYVDMAGGYDHPDAPVGPRLQMLVEYNGFYILNVHLPCRPWVDDGREQYLTRLIKSTEKWSMSAKPLNPLIVMGDFNIANFEVLRDNVLLRTAVNMNQLQHFFDDEHEYTCCLRAPGRPTIRKPLTLDYIFVLPRGCLNAITTSKTSRNYFHSDPKKFSSDHIGVWLQLCVDKSK